MDLHEIYLCVRDVLSRTANATRDSSDSNLENAPPIISPKLEADQEYVKNENQTSIIQDDLTDPISPLKNGNIVQDTIVEPVPLSSLPTVFSFKDIVEYYIQYYKLALKATDFANIGALSTPAVDTVPKVKVTKSTRSIASSTNTNTNTNNNTNANTGKDKRKRDIYIPNRWPTFLPMMTHNLYWIKNTNLPCVCLGLDLSVIRNTGMEASLIVLPISCQHYRHQISVQASALEPLDEDIVRCCPDDRAADLTLAIMDFCAWELDQRSQAKKKEMEAPHDDNNVTLKDKHLNNPNEDTNSRNHIMDRGIMKNNMNSSGNIISDYIEVSQTKCKEIDVTHNVTLSNIKVEDMKNINTIPMDSNNNNNNNNDNNQSDSPSSNRGLGTKKEIIDNKTPDNMSYITTLATTVSSHEKERPWYWYKYPTFIMSLLNKPSYCDSWRKQAERDARRSNESRRKIYFNRLLSTYHDLKDSDVMRDTSGALPWDDRLPSDELEDNDMSANSKQNNTGNAEVRSSGWKRGRATKGESPKFAPIEKERNSAGGDILEQSKVDVGETKANMSTYKVDNSLSLDSQLKISTLARNTDNKINSNLHVSQNTQNRNGSSKDTEDTQSKVSSTSTNTAINEKSVIKRKYSTYSMYWISTLNLPCLLVRTLEGSAKEERLRVQPVCCSTYHYEVDVNARKLESFSEEKLRLCGDERTYDFTLALVDLARWLCESDDLAARIHRDPESLTPTLNGSSADVTVQDNTFRWPRRILILISRPNEWSAWRRKPEKAAMGRREVRRFEYYRELKLLYEESVADLVAAVQESQSLSLAHQEVVTTESGMINSLFFSVMSII